MDGAENAQASKMSNLNGGKRKGEKGPLQVRSCPPSPQRFPSPLKPLQTRCKTSVSSNPITCINVCTFMKFKLIDAKLLICLLMVV